MAKYSLTDVIRRGKLDGGFKKVKRKFQCIDRNLFDKQFVYEKGDWIKKKSKMELNSHQTNEEIQCRNIKIKEAI